MKLIPSTIPITLAIDQHCQYQRQCKRLKSKVLSISKEFNRQFGISFNVVHCQSWETPGGTQSIDALLAHLKSTVPVNHGGILIGLTGKKKVTGKKGRSFYQEGVVALRLERSPRFFKKLLKHELYHIFGATHIADPDSLMHPQIRGKRLKSINRKIIALHKDRIFSRTIFPVAQPRLGELAELYRQIARFNEQRMRNPSRLPEEVYLSLALVYIEMKKYPEVIEQCEKALGINPGREEAYNLMGIAARRSGKPEKAITYYQEILRINPSHPSIYRNMGIAYFHMNPVRIQQALAAFEKAISLAPNHAELYTYTGKLHVMTENMKEAAAAYLKSLELKPGDGRVHYLLSGVYSSLKEYQKAREHLQRAKALGVGVKN